MARRKQESQDAGRQTLVVTGILVTVAAAITVGVVVGVKKAWQAVAARPEFLVRPGENVLNNPWVRPDEMKKDFLRTDRTGTLRGSFSIFTRDLPERVADAYAASPWVRNVVSVSKEFPNRLSIQLEIREPYALVKVRENHYCVDREGFLLSPQVYLLTADRLASLGPVVAVPPNVVVPCAGWPWEEVAVREGLVMVALCRDKLGRKVAVRSVEIQNDPADGGRGAAIAALVLEAGPRVQWGRTPSSPASPVEVATPKKTAALLAITRQEGPQINRFKAIDVRWSAPLCE